MTKKVFIVICSVLLLLPVMVLAGAEQNHGNQDIDKMNGKTTTLEGTLVCKNCSLKKEFGARSECKINGCQQALKTSDGRFIDFLDNKYAQDLKGKKYSGKKIKVTGTLFAHANTMDVQSITTSGKTVSWCNHCSAMDGCAAKK